MSERLELRSSSRPASCPYCKGDLLEAERRWVCPRCTTGLHADCARANGGCTVLGCGGRFEPRLPTASYAAPRHALRPERDLGSRVALGALVVGLVAILFWVAIDSLRALERPSYRSRPQDGITSWAEVEPGTSFTFDTTDEANGYTERETYRLVERDDKTASVHYESTSFTKFGGVRDRPLAMNRVEGWSPLRRLGEDVVETPIGPFRCWHFATSGTTGSGERSEIERWIHPLVPEPVKEVSTWKGVRRTTLLVKATRR